MKPAFEPTPENLAECRKLLGDLRTQTDQLGALVAERATELQSVGGEQLNLEELLRVTAQLSGMVQTAQETVAMLESPLLTDPWFDATFYGEATATSYRDLPSMDGAQGVTFWCPCGYGKPEYPLDGARPHQVQVPFANPRNAPPVPAGHGPGTKGVKPRWVAAGTGLADLTLTPSVNVGAPSCWHGFITNGRVTLGG